MKKIFSIAVLSVTLAGVVTFTACSSDDNAPSKPVIEKKDLGKGVATQFAFNFSTTPGTTRTTPNIVQALPGTNTFRGMESIYLIPMDFAQAKVANAYDPAITVNVAGTNTTIGSFGPDKTFANSDVLGTAAYSPVIYNLGDLSTGDISTEQSSKVYSLTLPVGTSNFLFYGKAPKGDDNLANNALTGKIASTLATNLTKASEITFKLVTIEDNPTSKGTLLGILNDIVGASYEYPAGTTKHWYDVISAPYSTDPNFTTMKAAYDALTVKTNEVRAGSAEAIRATVQSLYRTVLSQSRVGQNEEVKAMAKSVRDAIETAFDVYFYNKDEETTTFKFDGTDVVQVAAADVDKQTTAGTYDYNYYNAYLKYKNTDPKVYNYPMELGLPAGSARLTFDAAGHAFSWVTTTGLVDGTTAGTDLANICFPAELTYFCNSGLRATEVSKEVKDYPITVSTWDDPTNAKWADWTLNYVSAGTRAVAMKDNINYGVAMLKTVVVNNNATLYDNRKAILNDGITEDQLITTGDKAFIMTGVLVGGQPNQVGWDFLPTATVARDKVVYDRMLSKNTKDGTYDFVTYPDEVYVKKTDNYAFVSATPTQPNYTLLFDNWTDETNQKDNVAVAIELINNTGKDFYGRDNIIPAGGTFYLAGQLKTGSTGNQTATTVDWLYNETNNEYTMRFPAWGKDRIFIQDHTTNATFSFSADALKKAYSTVPDLRSIQMLFGLSVDLNWKTGMEFSVTEQF
jgi:hypothetical protein